MNNIHNLAEKVLEENQDKMPVEAYNLLEGLISTILNAIKTKEHDDRELKKLQTQNNNLKKQIQKLQKNGLQKNDIQKNEISINYNPSDITNDISADYIIESDMNNFSDISIDTSDHDDDDDDRIIINDDNDAYDNNNDHDDSNNVSTDRKSVV